ncbi:aminotransferase family protein [Clostridium sporogenes]|uniref:aminotransferase family protein n=1 Tax=Clostridium sporogenes TaxID=1509 RepID=UPI0022388A80|nr:aspartate aminotransferase family protein [Clostridium sporogenes]MCW6109110.1 aspartate aminotransferase family protein [Clostridium sporogenes]
MGNYWRPFNPANSEMNLTISKGEGVYLYDNFGRKYIDAFSGLWNVNFGYSDPEIKEAIKVQVDELPFVNPITLNNKNAIELSSILCSITHDDISKVVYTCSGSESIEAAIKISRKYSKFKCRENYHIAVIEGSYHGNYYGSMAASNYDEQEKYGYGPMLDGFLKLPMPFCRCCKTDKMSRGCIDKILHKLDNVLEENKDKLCAVIVEPIIASGGIIPLFEEYITRISDFCKRNDILFICDEVATGFGRTGSLFCFQHHNLKPDLIALSKGINNGYLPLGALCITKKVENEFIKNKEILFHFSTQNANPICLSAALATLKKMESNHFLSDINEKSEYLKSKLNCELNKIEMVFEIRIYGLMIAIDLIDPSTSKPITKEKLFGVISKLYELGCLAGISFSENITSSILLFPQFISSNENLIEIVTKLKLAIVED